MCGSHLFAIATDKSVEYGFGDTIVGYAANMDLVNHYCSVFKAEHTAMLSPGFRLQYMKRLQS